MIITAQFSEEGLLSGTTGCNQYTTSYVAEDGRMEIQMAASTLRACTFGMEQEAAYLQALTQAESYSISGATLEITNGGGQGVLRFTSRNMPLENTLWTLVAMNGAPQQVGLAPTTLLFEPGEQPGKGVAGGAAMCNTYRGGYSLDGDALAIEAIAMTMMACPETIMQTEAEYVALLEAAQSYQVVGETLVITSEKGLLTYSASREPLEGTYWRLTSMGDVESPTIPSLGADFIAQFVPQEGGPSGVVVGSTGCNDYNAAYVASLNEIKVNLPNITNNAACPPDFWEQEQQFFLGLNAASTYRILGNTLTIPYDEGRQALNFVAFVPPVEPAPEGGALTPLDGTRWWLVMIGPGQSCPARKPPTIRINADGKAARSRATAAATTITPPSRVCCRSAAIASTKQFLSRTARGDGPGVRLPGEPANRQPASPSPATSF